MSFRRRLLDAALTTGQTLGLWRLVGGAFPHHLTVLAYHRVIDPFSPGFDTFRPNVSATPAGFARQIAFVKQRFNVISIDMLIDWLQNDAPLPPRPLLITFDDGYADNYHHAYPVLAENDLPAIVFLATGCIQNKQPFFWDLVAYCCHHTRRKEATLPLVGRRTLASERDRNGASILLVNRLKALPEDEKQGILVEVPAALDVEIDPEAFSDIHMTWDQVAELSQNGVTLGGHTQTHPILTRVPDARARVEIVNCRGEIEAHIGRPVTAFAYPNGLHTDFDGRHRDMLKEAGYSAAFSLEPGPSAPQEVRSAPYAIRRILISNKDSLARFAGKIMGGDRLFHTLGKSASS
jgi:peptidoglycan/xylan/chitin deacetylase (PgdA/CDA1 family)